MGILSRLTIAIIGTLPYEPFQIKKWVEANGGKWSPTVKRGVTHLISSKEEWKKASGAIHQASDLGTWIVSYDWFEDSLQGKRKLSEKKYTWEFLRKDRRKRKELKRMGAIVDGKKFREGCEKARELTGSGTSKAAPVTRKPKKSASFFFTTSNVPTTPFVSATEDLKRRRVEREAAQAVETRAPEGHALAPIVIEDECTTPIRAPSISSTSTLAASAGSASKKTKSPSSASTTTATTRSPTVEPQAKTTHFKDLYHYYLDSTGFEYKIVLARSDFSINSFARYHIGLLESHTKPQTYCTIVQYTPPSKRVPGSNSGVPAVSGPGLRNHLLNFLNKGGNAVAQQPGAKKNGTRTVTAQPSTQHPEAARLQGLIAPPTSSSQQAPRFPPNQDAHDAEAVRLQSLVTKPSSSPELPYKGLICPMNSDFPSAWRAFRHAFRDLTLLTWEERFDANHTTQKARAQHLYIEPFLYSKPARGMPMGLLPQEAGFLQGSANGLDVRGESDDGYVRNSFNLPSIDHPLSKNGAIGSALHREEEQRKKREEEVRIKAEEREKEERRKRGEGTGKRPNYNKPLFNCVTGRPDTDGLGGYTTGVNGGVAYAGLVKGMKPFPYESGYQ